MTLTGCGLFDKDKYISIAGAIINLIVSIILVQFAGISGVIWGTIISQFVQLLLKAKLLFQEYFEMGCGKYLLRMLLCFAIFILELSVTYGFCYLVPSSGPIVSFGMKMIICLIVPNMMTFILFHKTDAFHYLTGLVMKTLKRK